MFHDAAPRLTSPLSATDAMEGINNSSVRIDSATAAMLLWLLVWVSKPAALPLDEAAMLLPNLGARIVSLLIHGFVRMCLEIVEMFRKSAAEEHGRFANNKIRFISDNMLAPSTDLIFVSLTLDLGISTAVLSAMRNGGCALAYWSQTK